MSPNWFVGFPVNPEPWYEEVITNVPAGIKCFNAADLHVTFAFLGPAGESRAMLAWQEACKLAIPGIDISLGPAEPFGNPDKLPLMHLRWQKAGIN